MHGITITDTSRFGKPTFFITMTCNPRWREILDNVLPNQSAIDRPDIVSRVFSQKQKVFLRLLYLLIINYGFCLSTTIKIIKNISFLLNFLTDIDGDDSN